MRARARAEYALILRGQTIVAGERIGAALSAWQQGRRLARARRREAEALAVAGETVAAALSSDHEAAEPARSLARQIAAVRLHLGTLAAALDRSLDADRADYAAASPWARPLVVVRGLAERAVLRDRIAQGRRSLRPLYEALGAAVLGSRDAALAARVPAAVADAIAVARAEAEAAAAERARRLAPFGGAPLPAWSYRVAREARALGEAVWQQLRPQILPRLPALAGLAAGWWVARTFTDSPWRAMLHSLGIGRGGTRVVTSATYRALSFWLPLLAAALSAYAGSRLAALVRRRYGPPVRAAAAGGSDAVRGTPPGPEGAAAGGPAAASPETPWSGSPRPAA